LTLTHDFTCHASQVHLCGRRCQVYLGLMWSVAAGKSDEWPLCSTTATSTDFSKHLYLAWAIVLDPAAICDIYYPVWMRELLPTVVIKQL
jgi:hypothetical protein